MPQLIPQELPELVTEMEHKVLDMQIELEIQHIQKEKTEV